MKRSVLLFLLFVSSYAFPQTTYEFLKLDTSPRAAALGGSFVTNFDDPDVIFYNPAGINLLKDNPASFSFTKHLLDINFASVSFSTDLENIGRIAAGVTYANYGTFKAADEFGNRQGEFSAGEAAFIVGYGGMLDENFYYGINGKFIYSSIETRSSSAIAADLGAHYVIPSQQMNIGLSILNLGSQVSKYYTSKEDLPLNVVAGVSKKLEHLPLKLSADFHKLNEESDNIFSRFKNFSVGAEFTLSKVLTLRLGYNNEKRRELKIGTTAGIAGFNIGLGAQISEYQFNYGYSSLGLIGGLHRVNVSTNF